MSNKKEGPSKLSYVQLGQLADITMGQSPDSSGYNTNQKGLPFLQGCAEFGRLSPIAKVYCNPPLRVSRPESILISVRAPVGTQNWGDESYCIGRGLSAIKAREGIADTKFLSYVIANNVSFLHRRSQGSTFLAISANDLRVFPIPHFDFPSQLRISAVLQSIDDIIEKTAILIEKYQKIRAGMMFDFFTRGITPDGKLRPNPNQSMQLYKNTPLGLIPKEWEVVKITEILDSLVDGPFGSNLKTEHYVVEPGVRVVRLQNIDEYKYDDSDKSYISDKHAGILIRNKVLGDDVLIAGLGDERYPVGRSCSYPMHLPTAVNKADCFRARCNSSMKNKFLMLYLNNEKARAQIRCYEQGVTRPRINTSNLKKLLIVKPCLSEQEAIVS
ncbi:hypothetical protein B6109_19410, partial [Salmonella enterica]|nr:hypothetical protein [Salmonella enterica]